MSTTQVAESLKSLLKDHGFKRRRLRWARDAGLFIDVIDIQRSQWGPSFTINLGVLDKEVHWIYGGTEPPAFPLEVHCTARERIGFLLDSRRDKWWEADDESAPSAVVQVVEEEGLPFLERMHSREALAAYLHGSVRRHEPPPNRMYLAILIGKLGHVEVGCGRLRQILEDFPDLHEEIGGVISRLGCA